MGTAQDSSRHTTSFATMKAVIALAQALYATSTLYCATGDQVSVYGFAAFGLTVAPYVVLSLVNLLGNTLTLAYPALYLVESEIFREAQGALGSVLSGQVGRLIS